MIQKNQVEGRGKQLKLKVEEGSAGRRMWREEEVGGERVNG